MQSSHKNRLDVYTLQHAATHCNTPQPAMIVCNHHTRIDWMIYTQQHTATHCNTLQHTATHCNTLQHPATHCNTPQPAMIVCNHHTRIDWMFTHSNTVQHTATHHSQPGLSASHKNRLDDLHTATHCNTLKHTATHRNTPQPAMIICNHRTRIDWMFMWSLCLRLGILDSMKIVLKDSLKSIPGFGWAMQVFCVHLYVYSYSYTYTCSTIHIYENIYTYIFPHT